MFLLAIMIPDPLLFSLVNPVISLPNLFKEFERYGALSNLKISFLKSEAMGINLPQPLLSQLQMNFKLKWNNSTLTYLDSVIPSHISKVFKLNFPPLMTRVRALLNKWNTGGWAVAIFSKWVSFQNSCTPCRLYQFIFHLIISSKFRNFFLF